MTTNGSRKWREKKRLKVGCPTLNPPQTHTTKLPPIIGIADTRFVITVAPQSDICPQGNT